MRRNFEYRCPTPPTTKRVPSRRMWRNFVPSVSQVARLHVRVESAEGGVRFEGVVVTCTDDGKARGIEAIRVDA